MREPPSLHRDSVSVQFAVKFVRHAPDLFPLRPFSLWVLRPAPSTSPLFERTSLTPSTSIVCLLSRPRSPSTSIESSRGIDLYPRPCTHTHTHTRPRPRPRPNPRTHTRTHARTQTPAHTHTHRLTHTLIAHSTQNTSLSAARRFVRSTQNNSLLTHNNSRKYCKAHL